MRWIWIALFLAVPAIAITGDLNKDGKVDFDDFFILADNFGKKGPPEVAVRDTLRITRRDTIRTTVHDTVKVADQTAVPIRVDFDVAADLSGWTYNSANDWRIDNGKLIVKGHGEANNTAVNFPTNFTGDQDISVEATGLSGSGSKFGLQFRNSAQGTYCWGLSGYGNYSAARWDPTSLSWFPLVDWTPSSFRATDSNLLRVSIKGDRLTFYINGQKAGEATDSHLSGGLVGLFVGGTDEVSFDNLVIARPGQLVESQVVTYDTVEVERVVRDTVSIVRVDTVFSSTSTPRLPVQQSWSDVVNEIQPTLYWIGVTQKPQGSTRFNVQLVGTGFAVDPDMIVTNHHVGVGAQERLKQYPSSAEPVVIAIRAGTRAFESGTYYLGTTDQSRNLLGLWHPGYDGTADSPDIAIFTPYNWTDGSRATLPQYAHLASLDDLFDLEVGEDIGVLGFPGVLETTYDPFALIPTPTFKSGTISAFRPYDTTAPLRAGTETLLLGKVVQHNLGIAPGNSGSPIFNKRGEVIAIANATILGSATFDFGIRADEIRLLIKALYLANNVPPPANGKPVASSLSATYPQPTKQRR